jgi:hypothetical protein
MVTRTVRHKASWSLKWQLERFLAAEVGMASQRSYKALMASVGCVGTLRVLEVTWGAKTGWHVHTHSLLFLSRPIADLAAFRSALFGEWRAAAAKQKFATSPEAFDLDNTSEAIADYIAKWGREPTWGVEDEMTKSHVKLARGEGRFTPFGLAGDHPDKFLEYARAFKGRQQMRWSKGLREHLLPSEVEVSDYKLASEPLPEYEPWALLSVEELRAVDYARLHHEVMEIAGEGDHVAFAALIQRLHSRFAWLSKDHDVGGCDPPPVEYNDGEGLAWF